MAFAADGFVVIDTYPVLRRIFVQEADDRVAARRAQGSPVGPKESFRIGPKNTWQNQIVWQRRFRLRNLTYIGS